MMTGLSKELSELISKTSTTIELVVETAATIAESYPLKSETVEEVRREIAETIRKLSPSRQRKEGKG